MFLSRHDFGRDAQGQFVGSSFYERKLSDASAHIRLDIINGYLTKRTEQQIESLIFLVTPKRIDPAFRRRGGALLPDATFSRVANLDAWSAYGPIIANKRGGSFALIEPFGRRWSMRRARSQEYVP